MNYISFLILLLSEEPFVESLNNLQIFFVLSLILFALFFIFFCVRISFSLLLNPFSYFRFFISFRYSSSSASCSVSSLLICCPAISVPPPSSAWRILFRKLIFWKISSLMLISLKASMGLSRFSE